jgi:hypothetical protein
MRLGDRDTRRWLQGLVVSLLASIIFGVAWFAFGIRGRLLGYSLAMLVLLILGVAIPLVISSSRSW